MSSAAGFIPEKNMHFAHTDGQTLSISEDRPVDGMTVIAFSDSEDDGSVLLLPTNLFRLAAKTYLGVPA